MKSLFAPCFVALAWLAHASVDAGKKETELQGTWTIVSSQLGGVTEEDIISAKVVFDGEKFVFKSKNKNESGRFRLDATKKPKQIDLLPGDDKFVVPGIYVVDGDSFKICFNKNGKVEDRPKEFASPKGSEIVFGVLKRDKK